MTEVGQKLQARPRRLEGFRLLLRLNMDWLRFCVIVMIALYSGAYLMTR
jgi:hypothetical protein